MLTMTIMVISFTAIQTERSNMKDLTQSAVRILSDPERNAGSPEVYHFAWAALKAIRCETYRPENLPSPMHVIIDETPLITRIRAYARSQGYPLSGDRSA